MCVVSNISEPFAKKYEPWVQPQPSTTFYPISEISRQEFEELKKEVKELGKLIKAAMKFDADTGQPECHDEGKLEIIRKMAELLGVEIDI